MKPFRELEYIVRGFSNHRRIQIIGLLAGRSELSVEDIADDLNINLKTASEHIRRLHAAGLVMKRNEGRRVRHALTKRAKNILTFLRMLE